MRNRWILWINVPERQGMTHCDTNWQQKGLPSSKIFSYSVLFARGRQEKSAPESCASSLFHLFRNPRAQVQKRTPKFRKSEKFRSERSSIPKYFGMRFSYGIPASRHVAARAELMSCARWTGSCSVGPGLPARPHGAWPRGLGSPAVRSHPYANLWALLPKGS